MTIRSATQPSDRKDLAGDQSAEQVRQNLIAAKALIHSPKLWGKGMSEGRPGTYCALQAIIEAGGSPCGPEEKAFEAAIESGSITAWNDAGKRTHVEVLAAFDKAIASCGGEQ